MPDEGPLVVATFALPTEAEMARGLLESNGIQALLRDEGLVGVHPLLSNAVGGVKVVVPAEDAERAREILNDAGEGSESTGPELVDPVEQDPSEADVLAARALNAAGIGLLVFPPMLHIWSAWVLLRVFSSSAPLSPSGRKRALLALTIDLLVFIAVAAIVSHVVTKG
ncbi:MAG TPA: DUF2007 domain-containing protein [Myxococcales bacterium]|nr:DUF2007 domain-containing protein [Myxococcales bacterium]